MSHMRIFTIDNRPYTYTNNISDELSYDLDTTYLCHLEYLHCVSVIGDQSGKFLQGQLSCDINKVNNHSHITGLLCSLKGRIIAMMDVIQCHDYQLVMEKDITERTLSVLNKASMLSRVQLKPSNKYSVLGVIGDPSRLNLPIDISPDYNSNQNETACIYRISDEMNILLVENKVAETLIASHPLSLKGTILWHYLSLKNNRPSIYINTQGIFLPHRLDLHLQKDIISLDKGCFRGQEIIARTHYRAKLKHSFTTFISNKVPKLADKILHNGDEIGEIIDYCPINESEYLVAASVKKEMLGKVEME